MPFTNIAINSVTEPNKVLNAAVWNLASPAEYGPKTPYKFVTMNGAIEGIETMLTFLADAHPEIKTIAVLHPDDGSVRFIQPHLAVYSVPSACGDENELAGFGHRFQ